MAANSQFASAVQILCFIAYVGGAGTNAEVIARSMQTNPVVCRRILKSLERAGLVVIRQGKDGGVRLNRPPNDVTLDQIHKAVEAADGMFALRERGNPDCPVNRTMESLLTPVFRDASQAVSDRLRQVTLADLVAAIPRRASA
jgi:Rrf2 family protein